MTQQPAARARDRAKEQLPALLTSSFGEPADTAVASGPFECRGGGNDGLVHYEVNLSAFVTEADLSSGVDALGDELDGFKRDDSGSGDEARPTWVFHNGIEEVVVRYTAATGVLAATWLTACGSPD